MQKEEALDEFRQIVKHYKEDKVTFICDTCEKQQPNSSFCGFVLLGSKNYLSDEWQKLLYPLKSRAASKSLYQICISCGIGLDSDFNKETEVIISAIPPIWGIFTGWVDENGYRISGKYLPRDEFNSSKVINILRLRALTEYHHYLGNHKEGRLNI